MWIMKLCEQNACKSKNELTDKREGILSYGESVKERFVSKRIGIIRSKNVIKRLIIWQCKENHFHQWIDVELDKF